MTDLMVGTDKSGVAELDTTMLIVSPAAAAIIQSRLYSVALGFNTPVEMIVVAFCRIETLTPVGGTSVKKIEAFQAPCAGTVVVHVPNPVPTVCILVCSAKFAIIFLKYFDCD